MGFLITVGVVLLIIVGMVWVVARRGAGRGGSKRFLTDGQSGGTEGARAAGSAQSRANQSFGGTA